MSGESDFLNFMYDLDRVESQIYNDSKFMKSLQQLTEV